MTVGECRRHFWELKFTAGANQRYHQRFKWYCGILDKSVRISVGILAVLSFWTAIPNATSSGAAFWIALTGVVVALVLNVIPVGDREKFHGEMFRAWSDLRSDVDLAEIKLADKEADENAPTAVVESVTDAIRQEQQLHADEPAPYRCILTWCECDERESLHGEGLRTNAQIEAERKRLNAEWDAISEQVAREVVEEGAMAAR